MNRKLLLFLVGAIFFTMSTGCQNKELPQTQDMKEWLEASGLYSEATKEELYEKALLENGLMIYTNTSRLSDVKGSFEKEYPGLVVEMVDIRSNTIPDAVQKNYDNRDYALDLVICTDLNGVISNDFVDNGILYTYVPYDIKEHIKADHCDDGLMFLGEAVMLFYNTRNNEASPIENWWQLTEDSFEGRVYMANPLSSNSNYALFNMIIKNADIMAKAYEEFYGEKLILSDGKNAGELFLEKLVKNAVIVNSSDEALEAIAGCDGENDSVGIMISSKIRYKSIGYDVAISYGVMPFDGLYAPNGIYIAGGSPNVNTAKLFIRWLLGETDGTGQGALPYLTDGTWSPRTDIKSDAEYELEELNMWRLDKDYSYEHIEEFNEFWVNLLEEYQ
ncbi:MAG: extracellular solute-binding protein [Oscillospiraceae bacterium]|jgi:iron(III) transport system substrate-binding protein